jgi:Uma2 family endonuclease
MGAITQPTRRWTRAEYERLVADGYFQPGERLELVNGEIVAMTPQNRRHAIGVRMADEALRRSFGAGFEVQTQLPLALTPDSLPEPDAAVLRGAFADYVDHPTSALLVVEVSDTTLGYDRRTKGPLYARSGIPEYWIVDVAGRAVEVYREPVETPEGWIYRLIERLSPPAMISPLAAPQATITVADLLP